MRLRGTDPVTPFPADQSRIDLRDREAVAYWCARYNCTAPQLRAAVAAVGISTTAVERFLKPR